MTPSPAAAVPPACPAHHNAADAGSSPGGLPALFGPGFAAAPDTVYARLRACGPAALVELAPGVEAFVVTSYSAALEVLRSPYFSKDARRWQALARGQVPTGNQVVPMMGWRPSLLFADGASHLRLRTSIDDALALVRALTLRGYVQACARELIGAFRTAGEADLVAQYADRLPIAVFARLFGCPGELAERMSVACGQMIDAEPQTAQRGSDDLARCLHDLITVKRRRPGPDVTSHLLAHPTALSDEEMVHQLVVLIGAGTVPQAAWISTALMMLLTDDRFSADLTGGSLTVTDALNEALWTHSPMSNFCFHYATRPCRLHDEHGRATDIPTGVPVLISHAAANTGPALAAAGPDRYADNHAHLAWSAGPHTCPAQAMATTIAETAIETLLDALPGLELAIPATGLHWRPGPFHRSLAALPTRFPTDQAPTVHAHP
ncbi:cytochrome P450 [Streptomyces aidingensis]|uniref:Cytochrome P450 n=1 Tax=Streptomyces aidingensis TaxID=910347 RepID=A0A1I1VAS0_9ACTN|nr:cytochrome P450 [Streptomyces aidingensis]SFD79999.1 Cytochrome P450 [Streptomyces aidingensis]